jgi:amino acid transporter
MLEDDFRTSGWVWIDRYETWYVFDTYEAARHHQDAQKNADDQNVKAPWLISSVIAAFGLLPLLYGAPYVISSVVTFLVLVFAAPIWMTYRRSSRWRDRSEGDPFGGPGVMRLGVGGTGSSVGRTRRG